MAGATLADANVARFYIADPGATTTIEFDQSTASVAERGFATAVGVLKRQGSASGAVTATLSVAGDAIAGVDYSGAVPAVVSWEDGDADPKWFELAIIDDGEVEGDETISITVSAVNGASIAPRDTMTVTIGDGNGPNLAPNAITNSSLVTNPGSLVTLDGSQSNDPNGDPLTFQWSQTSGPTVTLSNADTPMATFTSPVVQSDTMLGFELMVRDTGGLVDTVQTTVIVHRTIVDPGGGGGSPSVPGLLILLLAVSYRTLSRTDRA